MYVFLFYIVKEQQKIFWILGIIIVLIFTLYIQQAHFSKKGGEYIPPELRTAAINLDESQARRQAENELINDLGQDYFNSHYSYLKTEPVTRNREIIGYKIYYNYDYDIENFEPKEMYIYIGVKQDHKIFYNKDGILNFPVEIIYSDLKTAEIDCLNAFPNETRKITNWNHKFEVDTTKDKIILVSTGQIENTVISCEFDTRNGKIINKKWMKVTKITPVEPK